MLAPPPEGTFDIEEENLPLKNPTKANTTPEQVPLLTQEAEPSDSDTPKKGKVRTNYFGPD